MTNLSRQQKELWKRIDEILYYKWDPIGISDSGWTRDEYQTYVPQVFKRALANDSPHPLAVYLGEIETVNMGLSLNNIRNLKIAELILEIKEECNI